MEIDFNESDNVGIIVLFGDLNFVILANSTCVDKDDKEEIIEILNSMKFDKSKINSNLVNTNQDAIDLTISNYKFVSNMSGTITYSENGGKQDFVGLSNCFSYAIISNSVAKQSDPLQTLAGIEDTYASMFQEFKRIELNNLNYENYNGVYGIYQTSINDFKSDIFIYILNSDKNSFLFIGSSIDDYEKHKDIFHRTVLSAKF